MQCRPIPQIIISMMMLKKSKPERLPLQRLTTMMMLRKPKPRNLSVWQKLPRSCLHKPRMRALSQTNRRSGQKKNGRASHKPVDVPSMNESNKSLPKPKAVFADAGALKEKLRLDMAKPIYDVRE